MTAVAEPMVVGGTDAYRYRRDDKKKTILANGRRNQCAGGADQRAENDETRFMTRQMWREEKILFSM